MRLSFRATSAHPRNLEGDVLLVRAAETIKRWLQRAHDDACRCPLQLIFSRVLVDLLICLDVFHTFCLKILDSAQPRT